MNAITTRLRRRTARRGGSRSTSSPASGPRSTTCGTATQDPARHQRWDVRFGRITYLPRVDGEPQRFTYATTVAPGVTIAGTGESLGDRDRPDGTRWSGLTFWADDRRSIIDAGAGYWRYVPTDDGVRFLTRYDYRPRWGRVGEVLDRRAFRPLFGWATAWSFDRLRLWLEDGTPPERSRDLAVAHAAASPGSSGCSPTRASSRSCGRSTRTRSPSGEGSGWGRPEPDGPCGPSGAVEAAFAVATVARSDRRWPFVVALAAMPTLAIGAAVSDRSILTPGVQPRVARHRRRRRWPASPSPRGMAGRAGAGRSAPPPDRQPDAGGPAMTSIYRRALGDDFDRLHPQMQWRFGFSSLDETCQIGTGVMDEVWRGPWWTMPFLLLGSTRRVLFPSRGRNVPFTIANYAYVDRFGRETVTWSRRFDFGRRRRAFDATMIHSKARDTIVDYLGTHQHLAVDIHCSVDDDGAMCIRSGEQRLLRGARRRSGSRWRCSGVADGARVVGRGRPALPHRGPRRQPAARPAVRLPRLLHRRRAALHRRPDPRRRPPRAGRAARVVQPARMAAARAVRWSLVQGGPNLARGPCSTSSARSPSSAVARGTTSLAT